MHHDNSLSDCDSVPHTVQDRSSSPPTFPSARVHPLNHGAAKHGQAEWAKPRQDSEGPSTPHTPSNTSSRSTTQPSSHEQPLTCESLASLDALEQKIMADSWDSGTSPKRASGAATPSEVETHTDVNIDMPSNGPSAALEHQHKPSLLTNGATEFACTSAPIKRLEHPADKSLFVSFILSILFLIGSLILFPPSVVLLFVILPLGSLVRKLMACCCCCARHRTCACCCSRTLANQDHFWLHDSKFNKMVTQCLFMLESGLDITRIRDLVHARLISAENKGGHRIYPRFTHKLVPLYSGYAWRIDPDFHIENHVFAIPSSVRTDKDLQEYIADQADKSIAFDKPLWELHILNDFGGSNDTVLLFRIHPCMSDGISLMRLLLRSLVDQTTNGNVLKPRFGRGAFVFNFIRAIFVGPLVFLQKWLFTRGDYNLLRGPHLSGHKVVAWSEPFSLPSAIRIKQVTRSTLNDVLLAVTAGNIRKCLQHQGVANPYDLLATIPIDLRSDSPYIKMGVRFALNDISMPTNTEGTIPRLWEVKHRMDELKNSADPVIMYGSTNVLANIMPASLWHKIWSAVINKSSCFISNLQGPDYSLTFASRQVKRVMYWMPTREDVALSISFLTYSDQLQMAVMADRVVVPNPEIITQDFICEVCRAQIHGRQMYESPKVPIGIML